MKAKKQVKAIPNKSHPLLLAIIDQDRRKKLEAVCKSLESHKNTGDFYYGCGDYSEPWETVREWLEATK